MMNSYEVWVGGLRGELLTAGGGFTNAKVALRVAKATATEYTEEHGRSTLYRVLNEYGVVRHEGRIDARKVDR